MYPGFLEIEGGWTVWRRILLNVALRNLEHLGSDSSVEYLLFQAVSISIECNFDPQDGRAGCRPFNVRVLSWSHSILQQGLKIERSRTASERSCPSERMARCDWSSCVLATSEFSVHPQESDDNLLDSCCWSCMWVSVS